MCWVGGQITLSAVVVPVVRAVAPAATHLPLLRATGRRFAVIANTMVLPTLLLSGLALFAHRRVRFDDLHTTTYGRLLAAKLVLVAVSITLAAAHGLVARRRPRASRPLAVAGLVVATAIVAFATALVP
jgi:putative copper export protein